MTTAPGLGSANADLMDPLAALLRETKKDLPTKVGCLVDMAGALLATSERMGRGAELRHMAEEMRKRLIKATRAHQAAFAERQENARTAPTEAGRTAGPPAAQRRTTPAEPGQAGARADR